MSTSVVSSYSSYSQSIPLRTPFSIHSPSFLSFPRNKYRTFIVRSERDNEAELLRKPVIEKEKVGEERNGRGRGERGGGFVDWEDQILEDTVPLVGFVRMVLHSGKYESGDKLSPEHEKTILERLLPHHPECEKKIGCGVDYITVGYHPNFESSRCLFIVRKDGELVDFSYWKCIKGLIRKNYPLYADSFILRHFRRRTRDE